LTGIHIGIDVHQEHHIAHGYHLWIVLDTRSSPHKNEAEQLNCIYVEVISMVQETSKTCIECHIGPHGITGHVHQVVND